jgi:hypothetical protein
LENKSKPGLKRQPEMYRKTRKGEKSGSIIVGNGVRLPEYINNTRNRGVNRRLELTNSV